MKHLFFHIRLVVAVSVLFCCLPLMAQGYYTPSTLEEAINSPGIKDNKVINSVVKYQTEQAIKMSKDFNVNLTRNDEVICITIPADLFFESNSTELSSKADDILQDLSQFLTVPGFYNMVLAMYHDNTGSAEYCKDLTDKRIKSIREWFETFSSNSRFVSYFSFGSENPILSNDSINNRRLNRRLVIYLVPGHTMFEYAKKNMLNNKK